MEIRPIRTHADYENTLSEIETLMDAEPNTLKGEKLNILVMLAEAWEENHYPIDAPDAIEAIKFIMEHNDMTRKDLEPYIGSRARVSEIINHKRSLTLPMIRRLHDGLGIPAEILIRDNR